MFDASQLLALFAVRPAFAITLLCLLGLFASTAGGQITEATSNKHIWVAFAIMANDDTTLSSHGFFHQSLGLGSSSPLARSWTFSPSVWLIARETSDSHSAQLEVHGALTWHRRVGGIWFVTSGATVEFGTPLRDSDVKVRVDIEREVRFCCTHSISFAQWEGVRRLNRLNATGDNGRILLGIRTQVHGGVYAVLAYNRARGSNGNGPMDGVFVAALYNIVMGSHH